MSEQNFKSPVDAAKQTVLPDAIQPEPRQLFNADAYHPPVVVPGFPSLCLHRQSAPLRISADPLVQSADVRPAEDGRLKPYGNSKGTPNKGAAKGVSMMAGTTQLGLDLLIRAHKILKTILHQEGVEPGPCFLYRNTTPPPQTRFVFDHFNFGGDQCVAHILLQPTVESDKFPHIGVLASVIDDYARCTDDALWAPCGLMTAAGNEETFIGPLEPPCDNVLSVAFSILRNMIHSSTPADFAYELAWYLAYLERWGDDRILLSEDASPEFLYPFLLNEGPFLNILQVGLETFKPCLKESVYCDILEKIVRQGLRIATMLSVEEVESSTMPKRPSVETVELSSELPDLVTSENVPCEANVNVKTPPGVSPKREEKHSPDSAVEANVRDFSIMVEDSMALTLEERVQQLVAPFPDGAFLLTTFRYAPAGDTAGLEAAMNGVRWFKMPNLQGVYASRVADSIAVPGAIDAARNAIRDHRAGVTLTLPQGGDVNIIFSVVPPYNTLGEPIADIGALFAQ